MVLYFLFLVLGDLPLNPQPCLDRTLSARLAPVGVLFHFATPFIAFSWSTKRSCSVILLAFLLAMIYLLFLSIRLLICPFPSVLEPPADSEACAFFLKLFKLLFPFLLRFPVPYLLLGALDCSL